MSSSNIHSTQQYTLLKDIRPMMRKLDIKVIVLQQEGEPVIIRDGCIIKFMVADMSGVMLLNVFGSPGEVIRSGDILRITEVESKFRSGQHYLATSRRGKIQRVGQDTFPFVEGPNFSEPEPGANIPPSRAARAAVAANQAVGPGVSQQPSSKQPPYTHSGQSTTTTTAAAITTPRQPYANNSGSQPPMGQQHYRPHRNHGDGWRGSDGGKGGRIMGRKGGNDDYQQRPGVVSGGMEGASNQRDPRKRNLDSMLTSTSTMNNEDARSTRAKVSYNEFTP